MITHELHFKSTEMIPVLKISHLLSKQTRAYYSSCQDTKTYKVIPQIVIQRMTKNKTI